MPWSVNVAPEGRALVEKDGVVLSGSTAETPKLRLNPSATAFGPMAASTGGWFPAS